MENKSKKKYWIISILVLMVIGILASKPIIEGIIRDQAIDNLTEAYGAEVYIDDVSLEILSQKITITGIEFTHPYKPSHNLIAIPTFWMQF